MRTLYRAGDVDVLDAYHLSGGRVVSYRPGTTAEGDLQRRNDQVVAYGDDVVEEDASSGDGRHPRSEHEDLHRDSARGSEQLGVRHLDVIGGLLTDRFVLIEVMASHEVVLSDAHRVLWSQGPLFHLSEVLADVPLERKLCKRHIYRSVFEFSVTRF